MQLRVMQQKDIPGALRLNQLARLEPDGGRLGASSGRQSEWLFCDGRRRDGGGHGDHSLL
jgi:hypothetical protein